MRFRLAVLAIVALLAGGAVAFAAVSSAPQHLQAQAGVVVRWDAIPGVAGYQVKRLSGTWETLGSTKVTSYVDGAPPVGEVTYQVRGIAKGGAWGTPARVSVTSSSSVVTVTEPSETITVPGETVTVTVSSTTPTTTDPPVTTPTETTPTPPTDAAFLDDFNGPAGRQADPSRWRQGNGNSPMSGYEETTEDVLDGQGHLVIPAHPGYGTGVETKDRFGFVYGTVSARMKCPAQEGYWPGFWMLNGNETSETPVAETDVMEVYTQHGWEGANQTSHIWPGNDNKQFVYQGGSFDATQWHTYAAKIEPTRVTYSVDGVVTGVINKGDLSPWAYGPDVARPNYIILNLAIPGPSGMNAPTAGAEMLVDWVKVTA